MYCEIRVKGHLSMAWMEWLDGLTITNEDNGEALVAGRLPDQSALYGVLNRLQALNLPLISVVSTPDGADSPLDSSSDE
jgi:hypothetical protein